MTDCPNVAMRELLPGLLHGALTGEQRVQMEAHLGSCESCATELALLRSARQALDRVRVPVINTATIVASLPRPTASGRGSLRLVSRPFERSQVRRSAVFLRIAAAVTFVSVGGMSLAIARSHWGGAGAVSADSIVTTQVFGSEGPSLAHADSPVSATTRTNPSGMGVQSVLSELDDASLESLISELDQLEAAPLAEPESGPGSRMVSGDVSGS